MECFALQINRQQGSGWSKCFVTLSPVDLTMKVTSREPITSFLSYLIILSIRGKKLAPTSFDMGAIVLLQETIESEKWEKNFSPRGKRKEKPFTGKSL